MQDNLNGVNETSIDKLIMDICDLVERMNGTLNCMDELIDGTANYFVCENAHLFRQSFATVKNNFPIVNQNILEYTTDLVKVKMNYNNRRETIIKELNSSSASVSEKM